MLKKGIYEQVIYKGLRDKLAKCEENDQAFSAEHINKEEAAQILSEYIHEVVETALNIIAEKTKEEDRINKQIEFSNKLINVIADEKMDTYFDSLVVDQQAEQLIAIMNKRNQKNVIRPKSGVARSSLFTGAPAEPSMGEELAKEIASCDRIDMLVSFVRWTGVRQILTQLEEFTQNGGKLRIITTTYMGATEEKAITELSKLPNTEIKISYDTKSTRLHAKSYVFHRDTGFTTAYVGSSNLSYAAISSGLEWNLKVTTKELPITVKKIEDTFESYWNMPGFMLYTNTNEDIERLKYALKSEKSYGKEIVPYYQFDLRPYAYQQDILDKLVSERKIHNRYRNLVVAATGTGKTMIAAFDYKRYCSEHQKESNKLLFIAHREEILKQSLSTFRAVLKDANFGDLYTGNNTPEQTKHLFMTIQSFTSKHWEAENPADFYDYIVVDECHHAEAKSYQRLFGTYKPKILLGLTATPERMDGEDILKYFDQTIAAEIRLPEAIERRLLCPFQYFGVSDETDLSGLTWSQGGYKDSELENLFVMDSHVAKKRAELVLRSVQKYVADINNVKCLGFCVSVKHAEFMAKCFREWNIPAIALHGNSTEEARASAKKDLQAGKIKFIFVVDLYNEGVDIPEINTVLFLRPTKSLTIFLQQLGRGLRLADGKECLTVLDFIGQAHAKYRFEEKYSALLNRTHNSVQKEVQEGFFSVPKGCFIKLEKLATKYILDNLKVNVSQRNNLINKIREYSTITGGTLELGKFLKYYSIDPRTLYKQDNFTRLCVDAEQYQNFNEPLEKGITKALRRICDIDSSRWISFIISTLSSLEKCKTANLSAEEKIMLQMFQFTLFPNTTEAECEIDNIINTLKSIKNENPNMYKEILVLLQYDLDNVDFVAKQIKLDYPCALDLHCQYSRDQIFVALGYFKPGVIRQGVKWLENKNTDVFINTLNKAEKDYSPSTMYNDYSISDTLFHWQSQSTTTENSPTGQRYIHHKREGSHVLLFVREYKDSDFGGTMPFTFLGECNYVSHTGSMPMSIVWKLEEPIPAKFIKVTNKLVVE